MTAAVGPVQVDAAPLEYEARLDGVRAFAVLIVMLFHFAVLAEPLFVGGLVGVDIFFVLSGFLITNLLLDEQRRDRGIDFRGFYHRRILRLFPAMYAVLALYAVVAIFVGRKYPVVWAEVAAAALYSYHLFLGFFGFPTPGSPRALFHLWSLSVEEWFYFFWPLTLVAAIATVKRQKVLIGAAVAFIAFWMSVRLTAPLFDVDLSASTEAPFRNADLPYLAQVLYRFSIMRFDMLVLGCLLAFVRRSPRLLAGHGGGRTLDALAAAGALLLTAEILLGGRVAFFTAFQSVGFNLALLGIAPVLLWIHRHGDSRASRLLALPVAVWIGKRSYGLYLWHEVLNPLVPGAGGKVGLLVRIVVLFAASFGLAELSWRFIESPFLRRKANQYGRAGQRKPAAGNGPVDAPT
ncbi:MAG: acyltransferase family protein [Actinomycetes bacterium]